MSADGEQILTHVEFRSDAFPADPDEDELINPGRFGRKLAVFLGIGNYDEYDNGFLVFIEPSRPFVRLFPRLWQRLDTRPTVAHLQ